MEDNRNIDGNGRMKKARVYLFQSLPSSSQSTTSESFPIEKKKVYSSKSKPKTENISLTSYDSYQLTTDQSTKSDTSFDEINGKSSLCNELLESRVMLLTEQLKDFQRTNGLLKTQNQNLINENSQLKNDLGKLKSHDENKCNYIKQKYSKLKKLYKIISSEKDEIQRENETLKEKLAKMEEKITSLKSHVDTIKNDDVQSKKIENEKKQLETKNKLLQDTILNFETLIDDQSKEAGSAFDMKFKLAAIVTKLMKALEATENIAREAMQRNEELMVENDELKHENEYSQAQLTKKFSQAFDHVMDIIPIDITNEASKYAHVEPDEQLIGIADLLVAHLSDRSRNNTSLNSSIQSSSVIEDQSTLIKRYNNLYDFLDNTLCFVKKIARARSTDPTIIIRQQCARIGIFLEENKPAEFERRHASPFETTDIKEIIRIVNDFVGEERAKESPFAEVVMMLDAMATSNAMLMENAEINKNRIVELIANAKINKENAIRAKEAIYYKQRDDKLSSIMESVTEEDPIEWLGNNLANIIDENNSLKKNIEDTETKLNDAQSELSKNNQNAARERELFCKKAQNILFVIQSELKNAKADFASKIKDLQNELEETKIIEGKKVANIKDENKKVKETMQKEIDYYIDHAKKLEDQIEELKAKSEKEMLSTQEDFQKTKNDYENSITELVNINKALLKKHQQAKQRIAAIRKSLAETTNKAIKEANERKSSVNNQQLSELQDLRTKIESFELENALLTEKNEKLSQENYALQESNSKLQARTKTLKFKNDSYSAQLTRERESNAVQNAAVAAAIETKFNNIIAAKSKDIDLAKDFISTIARADKECEMSDLIQKAKQQTSKNNEAIRSAGSEALKLRKDLHLSSNEYLYDVFMKQKEEIEDFEKQLKDSKSIENKLKGDLYKAQKELQRCSDCTAEVKEWVSWARTMYMHVTNNGAPMFCSADLRFLLQESLLAGIGFGSLSRKIEVLRAEKNILVSPVYKLATPYNRQPTARTAMVIVIFANRLLSLHGIVNVPYAPLKRSDDSNDSTSN